MASNRNRVALIGKVGSGKTTLMQYLSELEIKYAKTQMVTYTDDFIDTPGEFLDSPFFKGQTISISYDAGLVILVASASDVQNTFPPNFVSVYNLPAIGVVTKIDREDADIKRGRRFLQFAGINKKRIFPISSITGEGIEELREEIHRILEKRAKSARKMD